MAVLIIVLFIIVLIVVYMARVYRNRKALNNRNSRMHPPPAAAAVGVPYYANGEASILPPGWTPGQGAAGPIPEKAGAPPTYYGPELDTGAMGAVANPVGSPVAPPAYSDITGVEGGKRQGYDNPMYDNTRLPRGESVTGSVSNR